jgi:aryl-alcohol dehydrogenase-like predicted oxidoreductase
MRYQKIPGTPFSPSVVCLGTGRFGTDLPEADAFRLLDAFIQDGGTFVDTAHVYGDWASDVRGMSERTIGAWLASSGARDRIVLATKGGHPDLALMQVPRMAPEEVRQDLAESLDYLRTDVIDLYWLHRDDPRRPVHEIVDMMDEHVREGTIRALGCSNWRVDRIREANEYATQRGKAPFVANQLWWSLAEPVPDAFPDPTQVHMDDDSYRLHTETGMAAVAYSSQANGFFSGAYGPGKEPDRPSSPAVRRLYYTPANFHRLERAADVAARLGVSTNQVALAYLLSEAFPAFAVVGPRTPAQLADSMAAGDLQLSVEDRRGLQV